MNFGMIYLVATELHGGSVSGPGSTVNGCEEDSVSAGLQPVATV
jgi:hypothetical protein